MQIKKVFNLEEDLTSDEFIATKQDMISEQCQMAHPDFLCKVYTYCTADKKFVIHTTEENKTSVGAMSRMLAHRTVGEQALMELDNDMVNTWEIIIKADTDLPDYVTALSIAQAKADEMMDADKTKMPIVTVVDYRWGNPKTIIVPTIFGDKDDEGNWIPPSQPTPIIIMPDPEIGRVWKEGTVVTPDIFDRIKHGNYAVLGLAAVQTESVLYLNPSVSGGNFEYRQTSNVIINIDDNIVVFTQFEPKQTDTSVMTYRKVIVNDVEYPLGAVGGTIATQEQYTNARTALVDVGFYRANPNDPTYYKTDGEIRLQGITLN